MKRACVNGMSYSPKRPRVAAPATNFSTSCRVAQILLKHNGADTAALAVFARIFSWRPLVVVDPNAVCQVVCHTEPHRTFPHLRAALRWAARLPRAASLIRSKVVARMCRVDRALATATAPMWRKSAKLSYCLAKRGDFQFLMHALSSAYACDAALIGAAGGGHVDIVLSVWPRCLDASSERKAFHHACQNGHLVVADFLRQEVGVPHSVFCDLVERGNVRVVRHLLPHLSFKVRRTDMALAIRSQDATMVALLATACTPRALSEAVCFLAQVGEAAHLRSLLEIIGAHLSPEQVKTALCEAVRLGYIEAVRALLPASDRDAVAFAVRTAAAENNCDCLALLLSQPGGTGAVGEALCDAAVAGSMEAIQILIPLCTQAQLQVACSDAVSTGFFEGASSLVFHLNPEGIRAARAEAEDPENPNPSDAAAFIRLVDSWE